MSDKGSHQRTWSNTRLLQLLMALQHLHWFAINTSLLAIGSSRETETTRHMEEWGEGLAPVIFGGPCPKICHLQTREWGEPIVSSPTQKAWGPEVSMISEGRICFAKHKEKANLSCLCFFIQSGSSVSWAMPIHTGEGVHRWSADCNAESLMGSFSQTRL